jgi:hypothetical protein
VQTSTSGSSPDRERAFAELSLLLPPTTVGLLSELCPPFKMFIMERDKHPDAIRWFPDGGLLIRGDCDKGWQVNQLWRMMAENGLFGRHIENNIMIASICSMPTQIYRLLYPDYYKEKLGGKGVFIVCPGVSTHLAHLSKGQLESLSVAVKFHSRVTRDVARAFVDMLCRWSSTVSRSGIFGEGSAFLRSGGATFQGLRVSFQIDVSRSGQNTINWLSLLILEFGLNRHPVTVVRYDCEDNESYEYLLGPLRGKVSVIPFPTSGSSMTSELAIPMSESEAASFVPTDAVPHPDYRSERFRVHESSFCSWDDLVVTVYFAAWPTEEKREQFRQLLNSWLTIGFYGGLGGDRLRRHGEVWFNEKNESARMMANMTGTDEAVAIPLLIRILEGFSAVVPIEAITIGGVGDLSEDEVNRP